MKVSKETMLILIKENGVAFNGLRTKDGTVVMAGIDKKHFVKSEELPLYLEVHNHSPTGFEWGYSGSGPTQLALAILMYSTGDKKFASVYKSDFRNRYITPVQADHIQVKTEDVIKFVQETVGDDYEFSIDC